MIKKHTYLLPILLFINCLSASISRENKTCIVAGGAGFLGSHLCEKLLNENAHVICLDNLHTGSYENIAHLQTNPRFLFVVHDICTPYAPDCTCDEIYNLAGLASPCHYQQSPIETTLTSVVGSYNLLELARKQGAKIFFSSTSEIYGDPEVHPQYESYVGNVNPIGPRACYDEGKRCAESLFFDYHRKYGVAIRVGRLFNTYGPKMALNDGRVVPEFINQALQAKPLTLCGSGMQTRSFCYVSDTISAILAFMDSPNDITGPINIGNPDEHTIYDLALLTIKLCDSNSTITSIASREDDPKKRQPDIQKAKRELHWEPKVSLEEGLKKTIDYIKYKKQ